MTEIAGEGASTGLEQRTDSYLMALRTEMDTLHVHNGAPSMRVIAARTSRAISHTTVHAVLRCRRLPGWGQLELVVEALDGDVDKFKQLWKDAREGKGSSGLASGPAAAGAVSLASPSTRDTAGADEETTSSFTQVIADTWQELVDDIESAGKRGVRGVATGFLDLDRLLNGFSRGQLVVVAGRPAIGKSMFALSVARHASIRQDVPVLFMSFRLSKLEVLRRLVAAEARVAMHVLQSGGLSESDWTKVARRMGEIGEVPFFVNDDYAPSLEGVVSEARRVSAEHGVGLLVVDSVDQLIELEEPDAIRSKEMVVSRALKRLAVELQIPVIAVDSVPQPSGDFERMSEPLALEDLNGIEEDADIVIVIHRDDFYDLMSPRAGEADFIVVKHRDGPKDTVIAAAQLHLARFVDMAIV